MSNVIPLRPAISNHAALCEVLIMALSRAVRLGDLSSAEGESILVRASARDCGVLRGAIECLLTRVARRAIPAPTPISPPRQGVPSPLV
jgi:hypothetical protein